MKTLNVSFTDAEFRKIIKAKKECAYNKSWHIFLLYKLSKGVREK